MIGAADAQTRPDFTGVWQRSDTGAARSVATAGDVRFRTGDMGSGWGAPLTISRRGDSLIVEFPQFDAYDLQPPLRYAYTMNGGESHNVVMIGHAPSEQRATVAWRGDTLVITTHIPLPPEVGGRGAMAEVRQALSLPSATSLTIETTRVGVRGGATTALRTAYTKR
jgi:hypothetical protein